MAINTIHTQKNTQDEMLSETNDLWAPISDEQQATISGGYQLQNRSFPNGSLEVNKKTGPTEMQRRCILGLC